MAEIQQQEQQEQLQQQYQHHHQPQTLARKPLPSLPQGQADSSSDDNGNHRSSSNSSRNSNKDSLGDNSNDVNATANGQEAARSVPSSLERSDSFSRGDRVTRPRSNSNLSENINKLATVVGKWLRSSSMSSKKDFDDDTDGNPSSQQQLQRLSRHEPSALSSSSGNVSVKGILKKPRSGAFDAFDSSASDPNISGKQRCDSPATWPRREVGRLVDERAASGTATSTSSATTGTGIAFGMPIHENESTDNFHSEGGIYNSTSSLPDESIIKALRNSGVQNNDNSNNNNSSNNNNNNNHNDGERCESSNNNKSGSPSAEERPFAINTGVRQQVALSMPQLRVAPPRRSSFSSPMSPLKEINPPTRFSVIAPMSPIHGALAIPPARSSTICPMSPLPYDAEEDLPKGPVAMNECPCRHDVLSYSYHPRIHQRHIESSNPDRIISQHPMMINMEKNGVHFSNNISHYSNSNNNSNSGNEHNEGGNAVLKQLRFVDGHSVGETHHPSSYRRHSKRAARKFQQYTPGKLEKILREVEALRVELKVVDNRAPMESYHDEFGHH